MGEGGVEAPLKLPGAELDRLGREGVQEPSGGEGADRRQADGLADGFAENVRPGGRSGRAACGSRTEWPGCTAFTNVPHGSSPVVALMAVTDPPLDRGRDTGRPVVRPRGSGTIRNSCRTRNAGRSRFSAGPRLPASFGPCILQGFLVTHFGHRIQECVQDGSQMKSRGGSRFRRFRVRPNTVRRRVSGGSLRAPEEPAQGYRAGSRFWRWARAPGRAMVARLAGSVIPRAGRLRNGSVRTSGRTSPGFKPSHAGRA